MELVLQREALFFLFFDCGIRDWQALFLQTFDIFGHRVVAFELIAEVVIVRL